MISCSEAVRELWDYLEQDLEPPRRQAVEQHLAFCRRCCGELEFAEELRRFMASPTSAELPTDVNARLRSLLSDLDGAEGDTTR